MTMNLCFLMFDCFAGFDLVRFLLFVISVAALVGVCWLAMKAFEYLQ